MAGTTEGMADSVKTLSLIVQERDKEIKETGVRIEYYKNALEKVLDEIKSIEKTRRRIAEQVKLIDKENELLECIENRLKFGQEVSRQSLINHKYFEQFTAKELEAKERESQVVEQECRNLYNEAEKELKLHPLYQELEKQRVEFLKADIHRRQLEVKIRKKKAKIAQKKEIEKRIFYNYYIAMAEEYVMEKRTEELRILKLQEIESLKRLFAVQEKVKLRQKLGIPRDKIKTMTNLSFGSKENNRVESKVCGLPKQKLQPEVSSSEKLENLFQQDESKNVATVPKVNILHEKVIVPPLPAFVVPQFAPAPAQKRKNNIVNLSSKWQKHFSKSSIKSCADSQELQQQSSEQSQLSQPKPLTPETHVVKQHNDYPLKNPQTIKPIIQTQENEGISINMKETVPPFQYQMVENMSVGADQFRMKYPQVMPVTPALQERPISSAETMSGRTIAATADVTYARPNVSVPKNEMIPKPSVSGQGKSVRFNLDQTNRQTELKFALGGGFGNKFSPFSAQAPNKNEILLQEQAAGSHNASFNLSLTEQEGDKTHIGMEFDSGDNQDQYRSPECTYEAEQANQPFKPSGMPSFGGGFFPFGKNTFNPF